MTEKNFSFTMKGPGEKYREPLLTIRGDSIEEFQANLEQAHAKDIFTAIGRAVGAFERGALMGNKLEARTVSVETTEEEVKAEPEKKPAPRTRAKAAPKTAPKATEEPEKGAEELEAAAARPEADKLAEASTAPEGDKPAPPKNPRTSMPAGVPKPKWMQ